MAATIIVIAHPQQCQALRLPEQRDGLAKLPEADLVEKIKQASSLVISKSEVDEWTREMTRLSFWIADLFAKGLGRNNRPFSWMLGRICFYGNFYPRCRDPYCRIVGFQPHTDPCLFSILLQDDSGGLKGLYNKNWYEIRPVRGALVIFVGDLMEILPDGVYESGIHYVKTYTCARPRVSVLQTFSQVSKMQSVRRSLRVAYL
ncbi:1-aminocyclopropane-1-carboxylate oxidase homolog 8-like [Silene latifolia]|uniref:1-aminocyclopropane-1-carboxylate oxidase homolog 8-like n=1 Tax=Silene latifolia TaxID=37657 RepID=UPI003D77917D